MLLKTRTFHLGEQKKEHLYVEYRYRSIRYCIPRVLVVHIHIHVEGNKVTQVDTRSLHFYL